MAKLNQHYERGQIRSLLELNLQQSEALNGATSLAIHSLESSKLDDAMTYLIDAKAVQLEQIELLRNAGTRLAALIRDLLPESTKPHPQTPEPPPK